MPEYTPEELQQISIDHKDLIERMATVALTKMRKPSPHSHEDLCQEGLIVVFEWVPRWYRPERGASLKTFITGGLRQHFTDLVWKSYQHVGEGTSSGPISPEKQQDVRKYKQDASEQQHLRNIIPDPCFDATFRETLNEKLTQEELDYILRVLDVMQTRKTRRTNPRTVVRRELGLTEGMEEELRTRIFQKLEA